MKNDFVDGILTINPKINVEHQTQQKHVTSQMEESTQGENVPQMDQCDGYVGVGVQAEQGINQQAE